MRALFRVMFAAAVAGGPTCAAAGLEVCNDTPVLQAVAIGYVQSGDRVSEGWWAIPPGACRLPYAKDLTDGSFFLFAKSPGWTFRHDDVVFCTTKQPFTISGVGDCAAEGYNSQRFHILKTVPGETYLRTGLSDLMSPDPSAPPRLQTSDAVFQNCLAAGSETICTFYSGANRYNVRTGGATPKPVFSFLQQLGPGTPIAAQGDVVSKDGSAAETVLKNVEQRPPTAFDTMLMKMQGQWVSDQDSSERLTILGAERHGSYDGRATGTEYLSVQAQCDGAKGAAAYLYARDDQSGDGLCYAIETLTETAMSLIFLPRGNLLTYQKMR